MKTTVLIILSILCYNIHAQFFQWRHMNSNINVFAQSPINNNILLVGDAAGLIRKSNDLGNTWKLASMQHEAKFNDIAFASSSLAFAATNFNGLLLISNDGGNTWARKQFKDSINPTNDLANTIKRIVVIDSNTIFFDIFNHPISSPTADKGIITRDGGNTFQVINAPGYVYHVSGDTLLAFGRAVNGFIYQFKISMSVNKGQTWSLVKTNPTGINNPTFTNHGIEAATIVNSKTFYLHGNVQFGSDKNCYKTTDGGQTFTPITSPNTNATFLQFIRKSNNDFFAVMNNNKAYYSNNGASTWTQCSTNVATKVLPLQGNYLIAPADGVSCISNDNGATWTNQSIRVMNLTKGLTNNFTSKTYLDVVNDTVAFASVEIKQPSTSLTDGGLLAKTFNNGLTWKFVNDSTNTPFNISAGYYLFLSVDTFMYTQNGFGGVLQIKRTLNGGQSSTVAQVGAMNEKIVGHYKWPNGKLALYSEYGGVYISDNKGVTWTYKPYSTITNDVVGINFPTAYSWFAVTSNGQIYKTNDMGNTWINITGSTSNCRGNVTFTDSLTGFAYGCNSNQIYKTINGGTTWTSILNNFTNNGIKFTYREVMGIQQNPSRLIVSGGTSPIAFTADTGNSWYSLTGVQSGYGIKRMDVKDTADGVLLSNFGEYIKQFGNIIFSTQDLQYVNGSYALSLNKSLPLEKNQVLIYPNPSSQHLNIDLSKLKETANNQKLYITNTLGQIVQQHIVNSQQQILDIQNLASGVYFLTVKTNHSSYSGKFVKE